MLYHPRRKTFTECCLICLLNIHLASSSRPELKNSPISISNHPLLLTLGRCDPTTLLCCLPSTFGSKKAVLVLLWPSPTPTDNSRVQRTVLKSFGINHLEHKISRILGIWGQGKGIYHPTNIKPPHFKKLSNFREPVQKYFCND